MNHRHAYKTGLKVAIKGEASHKAKVTDSQVAEIRRIRKETGRSYSSIAKQFGISPTHTTDIIKHIYR